MRLYCLFCMEPLQSRLADSPFRPSAHLVAIKNPSKSATRDRMLSGWVDGTAVAKGKSRTRRVDKGKSGQALKTAVSGGFGGGILSQIDKTNGDSFGGTEPSFVTQSMSNNSGAADWRLDEAWGSLPGKISSPHFFIRFICGFVIRVIRGQLRERSRRDGLVSGVSSSRFSRSIPPASEYAATSFC